MLARHRPNGYARPAVQDPPQIAERPSVASAYLGIGYPLQAAIGGSVNAILQTVIAFGVHINPSQNAAVTTLVNSLLVLAAVAIATVKHATP